MIKSTKEAHVACSWKKGFMPVFHPTACPKNKATHDDEKAMKVVLCQYFHSTTAADTVVLWFRPEAQRMKKGWDGCSINRMQPRTTSKALDIQQSNCPPHYQFYPWKQLQKLKQINCLDKFWQSHSCLAMEILSALTIWPLPPIILAFDIILSKQMLQPFHL